MTARQVALDALPFGPSKRSLCGRDTCPCGSGAHETAIHTFATCTRSRLLWFYVLRAWRTVTGETKVRETDIKLIIFGSRDHTWLDEHEQGEWAGLEAPFAILHKVTIHVQTILEKKRSSFCGTSPLRLCAPESLLSARAKPPVGSRGTPRRACPARGRARQSRYGGGWRLGVGLRVSLQGSRRGAQGQLN